MGRCHFLFSGLPPVWYPLAVKGPYLAVVPPEVEVDPLRGAPVPAAVAGGEGDAHHAAAVARGQPSLFVVAPAAHGLVLLALGHAALPRQAQDVGVAAQDGTVFHRRQHPY